MWNTTTRPLMDLHSITRLCQSMGYWESGWGAYGAADDIILYVLLKDAYGNNMTASGDAGALVNFTMKIKNAKGDKYFTNFTLSVQNDTGYEVISFNNQKSGDYLLYVSYKNNSVQGSPFPYTVQPGPLSSPNCEVLWLNESTSIPAGKQGSAEVLFVDAYNNSVNSYINFTMYFTRDGQTFQDVSLLSRRQSGSQHITFVVTLPGDYSLHLVYGGSTEFNGSPLNFTIVPASVSPSHCKGAWVDEDNAFKLGESGALKVFLMDVYGNLVSASTQDASTLVFRAYVTSQDGAKNSSIRMTESLDSGKIYYVLTINPVMSGHCLLYVTLNRIQVDGSPFAFTLVSGHVYIPYCLGSWLNDTNVFERGEQVMFKVVLKDELNTTMSSSTDITFTSMYVMDLRGRRNTQMRPTLVNIGEPDYLIVTFNATTTTFNTTREEHFFLRIGDETNQIKKSPFLFSVLPGAYLTRGMLARNFPWPNKVDGYKSWPHIRVRDQMGEWCES